MSKLGKGRLALLILAAVLGLAGCEKEQGSAPPPGSFARPGAGQGAGQGAGEATERTAPGSVRDSPAPSAEPAEPGAPVIVALGDSLTAGRGLDEARAYPAVLERLLREAGYPHRIVNAGVSGDTSAGGLARTGWVMRQKPLILIVALGANDGLRGQKPSSTRRNLAGIIEKGRAGGARVLLAGMRLPSNLGQAYTNEFQRIFPALAEEYGLPLVPFLLEGVALQPDLNQADGLHPNVRGTEIVAENVWRVLEPMLR